jgi:hypothetical protein
MTTKRQPQYFLGGAKWGEYDKYDDFINGGFWEAGGKKWKDQCQSTVDKMQPGDRIAIKKKLGQGSPDIMIRALGIITFIDYQRGIVFVDWSVKNLKRKVPCKGVFSTLHGPYLKTGKDADWVNQSFCL